MKFLRQTIRDDGSASSPCDSDFGDAIQFDFEEGKVRYVWTVREGKRVSGLLINPKMSVRISIVKG